MGEQINSIIDNLCERFGVTAQFLIPEIARYQIAVCGFGAFCGLVGIIVFIILARKSLRLARDAEDPESGWYAGFTISIALTLLFVLIFTLNLADVVGWATSPYGAMVNMLMRVLKK